MPRAPRKCPHGGCENRITPPARYCPTHTQPHWTNGYSRTSSPAHKAWAAAVLKRDRHQCQIDGPGCIGIARVADHIRPTAEGGAQYDIANGQAICTVCHKAKTQAEATRGLRRAFRSDQNRSTPTEPPF